MSSAKKTPSLPFWQLVCAICCAILGFVFAGPPGVVGGGVIGRYLGKMRDQTGAPLMGNWKVNVIPTCS